MVNKNLIEIEQGDLFFIGDIHCSDKIAQNVLSLPDNSSAIILGDIGVGFKPYKKEYNSVNEQNKLLVQHNIKVYCIRGNHDNPDYFYNETLNFSNIKFVPDYTVIKYKDRHILCVGGAISLDRSARSKKVSYWENEAPELNVEVLSSIMKEYPISVLATHEMPNQAFDPLEFDDNLLGYKNIDKSLSVDVLDSRTVIGCILQNLLDNNHPINLCVHGHYHKCRFKNMFKNENTCENVIFYGLGIEDCYIYDFNDSIGIKKPLFY